MSGTVAVNYTWSQGINGLLSMVRWADPVITFGYPTFKSEYGDDYQDDFPEPEGIIALNDVQRGAAAAAMQAVRNYTLLDLLEAQPAANADIRIAMTTSMLPDETTAYAFPPASSDRGGDVWFSASNYNNPILGTYAYQTFFHEIGHALGLKHGHEADDGNAQTLPSDKDSLEFSTMTYRAYPGQVTGTGYKVPEGNYPQTFMMYDIAALQHMYGADFGYNANASVYAFNPNTGEMQINGVGQGVPVNGTGNPVNVIFRTIWDGGGWDTYDFTAYDSSYRLVIDLTPGGWTDIDSTGDRQAAFIGPRDLTRADDNIFARGQVFNALQYLDPVRNQFDDRSFIEAALGGAGNDSIRGNKVDNWLEGHDGQDTLEGGDGNDRLDQGTGGGLLLGGEGNDTLVAGSGADTMDGETGDDLVDYSLAPRGIYLDLTFGGIGWAAGDVFLNIDTIQGTRFADEMFGRDGWNDFLVGGAGADTIRGRDGDDTLMGSEGSDTLTGGLGADHLVGGAGRDVANYRNATEAVIADLLDPAANRGEAQGDTYERVEVLQGGDFADHLGGNDASNTIYGSWGEDYIAGRGGADILYGEEHDDQLVGDAGKDTMNGGDGNDAMDGGTGADLLQGGIGDDDYYVDTNEDQVREAAGEGYDQVFTTATFSLHNTLAEVEELLVWDPTTTRRIDLTGSIFPNAIQGNAGANAIDGRGGADTMWGLGGNDTYTADDPGDVVIEADAAGRDLIQSSLTWSLVATPFVEQLALLGTGNLTGTGNDLANLITGNDSSNLLSGGVGRDTLVGGVGSDTLNGGSETDSLAGGDDGDLVNGDAGNDSLLGGLGGDTMWGGEGRDSLWGGDGDDILYIDNNDAVVNGGQGYDHANAIAATVATGFRFVAAADSEIEVIAGHDGNDRIDASAMSTTVTIVAFNGNDTVYGGSGDDVVYGWDGNDLIFGGLGFDQMIGGTGNDTIVGGGGPNNPPWTDWLYGDAGDDSLIGSGGGQVVGGAGNDTLRGFAGDLIMGGADNDLIVGNTGTQRIIGGDGNDTMTGGADFDRFEFDDGWGNDRITDFQAGIDKLYFTDVDGLDAFAQLSIGTATGGVSVSFEGGSLLLAGLAINQVNPADFVI